MQDSELHLVPKLRGQIVFSNSVRPEYRQLARHKLTVSLASVKLNLSDRRIGMALDFLENVPVPAPQPRPSGDQDPFQAAGKDPFPRDHMTAVVCEDRLSRIRKTVTQAAVRAWRGAAKEDSVAPRLCTLDLDK